MMRIAPLLPKAQHLRKTSPVAGHVKPLRAGSLRTVLEMQTQNVRITNPATRRPSWHPAAICFRLHQIVMQSLLSE